MHLVHKETHTLTTAGLYPYGGPSIPATENPGPVSRSNRCLMRHLFLWVSRLYGHARTQGYEDAVGRFT